MEKKNLIIYMPVLHRGYLDFLKEKKDEINTVYIIDEKLQKELSEFKPDIAAMDIKDTVKILNAIGMGNVASVSADNIEKVARSGGTILINDEISRNLAEKYLKGKDVEWQSVFLRWDKSKVLSSEPLEDIEASKDAFDVSMMSEAQKEAKKAGDWWRQIGAVSVKDGQILFRGFNRDLPSDHTPYQVGEVRDFFKAGERHDLASTIHAEENIVAQAARKGVSLESASLYVTTFPCPVCAKLIACSGIKKLYFQEGGSNFDARKVLESASIVIIRVPKLN
ncbi:MAG: deaminase [bacterium]|nr:deaminase [bacterium]